MKVATKDAEGWFILAVLVAGLGLGVMAAAEAVLFQVAPDVAGRLAAPAGILGVVVAVACSLLACLDLIRTGNAGRECRQRGKDASR